MLVPNGTEFWGYEEKLLPGQPVLPRCLLKTFFEGTTQLFLR